MNKLNLLLATIALCCTSLAVAQNDGNLNTDRPDQSEGVYTLPKGQFQIENGLVFSKEESSDNLMLRYGLITNTELRTALYPLSGTHRLWAIQQNRR